MEIKETEKYYIITPLSPKLNKREANKIELEIENSVNKKIALDMSFVKDCTNDFINFLSNVKELSLFNIQSDIFAILTSMNLDKKLKLFVTESDFENDKRQLLNRKFSIV